MDNLGRRLAWVGAWGFLFLIFAGTQHWGDAVFPPAQARTGERLLLPLVAALVNATVGVVLLGMVLRRTAKPGMRLLRPVAFAWCWVGVLLAFALLGAASHLAQGYPKWPFVAGSSVLLATSFTLFAFCLASATGRIVRKK